ncbi:MAG TPA: D-alanyl-D-alanine carboxypeptidase [Candidatus Dormibacteraeota bacterium]
MPRSRFLGSARTSPRRGGAWRPLLALVLLAALLAGTAYLQLRRPIPSVSARQTIADRSALPGPRPNLPWPRAGIAALGVTGLGLIETSPGERALPIWSIAKVMTALVVLDDKPLKKDEQGPTLTVTDADVTLYQQEKADKQSVVAVVAGEKLTEYQALEALLIPSGNNIGDLLANWDAGSVSAFVGRMNAKARSLQLAKTSFADTSGASEQTVSTPTDLTHLALVAEANPVVVQIVIQPQAELPVAGVVYNVDYALGQSGINGIKTGSNPGSGAGFMFASTFKVAGQNLTLVGAVMGLDTLDQVFAASRQLIDFAKQAVQVADAVQAGIRVGLYEAPWGARAGLVTAQGAQLVEWPGMDVVRKLEVPSARTPLRAGSTAGDLLLRLGDQEVRVPLATDSGLSPPTTAWRLTRLG